MGHPGSIFGGKPLGEFGAVDAGIDVSGAGNFEFLEARDLGGVERRNNFFGNLARRLAQLLGQLKGQRHGVLA